MRIYSLAVRENAMRLRMIMSVVTVFVACFTIALWAEPVKKESGNTIPNSPDGPEIESSLHSDES